MNLHPCWKLPSWQLSTTHPCYQEMPGCSVYSSPTSSQWNLFTCCFHPFFVLIQPKKWVLEKIPWWGKKSNSTQLDPKQIFFGSPENGNGNGNGKHAPDLQPCEEQRLTNFQVIGRLDMVGVDGLGQKNPRVCLFNGKRGLVGPGKNGMFFKSWNMWFFKAGWWKRTLWF